MRGKEEGDKMVVVVFSFGSKETKGNIYLGLTGLFHKERGVLAVIAQKDIPDISRDHKGEDFLRPFFYAEDFMREDGWHSTLWGANAAKLLCLHNGLPLKAIVAAAPMHIRRAVRDMMKVGFDVAESVSPRISEDDWYQKESSLPWTRSRWRWWTREIPLRLLPWWLYKRLTLKNYK